MKLHKSKAYAKGGKDYFSWKVNLPPEHIEAMGWEHGQELEAVQRDGGLLLRPKSMDDLDPKAQAIRPKVRNVRL